MEERNRLQEPVAVIVLERHGKVRAELKFPLDEQGEYPLTPKAKLDAQRMGTRLAEFLKRQGVMRAMRRKGAFLHFAPTPYIRTIQTSRHTAAALFKGLKEAGIEVKIARKNQRPVSSLRFLAVPPYEHYPTPGSPEAKQWEMDEERWDRGEEVAGWEAKKKAVFRTQTPLRLRRRLLDDLKEQTGSSRIPVYAWVSHGPARPVGRLAKASSPLGFAVEQFASPQERRKFRIPAELARGEALAAVVYSDGSVRLKHLKPND